MTIQAIPLRADAPPMPRAGESCNGCGACCAAERCPQALLFLPIDQKQCAALEWDGMSGRYMCGLVTHPADFVAWLPRRWEGRAIRWFARRIAVGSGCDFDASETDAA